MRDFPHAGANENELRAAMEREIADWSLLMIFGDAAQRREALTRLRELRALTKEQEDASLWRKPE